MAGCSEHAGREAVGRCVGCGKPICEECVEITDDSGIYCYDCAVSSQLSVIADREKAEAGRPAAGVARRKRFSTWVIVALIVMAVLAAAEVTYIVIARSGRTPPAQVSAAQKVVYGRDRCVMTMQEVRGELETARKEAGAYPDSLQQLADGGGSVEAACPLTGTPYVYESGSSDYHLACPNPGKHGVESLSATSTSVPRATGD